MNEAQAHALDLGESMIDSLEAIAGHLGRALEWFQPDMWWALFVGDILKHVHLHRARKELVRFEDLADQFQAANPGQALRPEVILPRASLAYFLDGVIAGGRLVKHLERGRRQAHIGIARLRVQLRSMRGEAGQPI